ncbi:hypothetical protein MTR_8g028915 [Medicago truncatula]|uniref:Uncharacterized protein n=1 Tax=Medicago truncatula TaxID=3880 RepID=A0A072TPU5_MEDTR|nr:hypothetical protein MTR_8g028915 [Medicago truncatula]
MGMGWGYPNPSGTGMRFNFSSPLSMDRVTDKYMRIMYGDGEDLFGMKFIIGWT